mgnify:CR=1 FL=1
MNAFWAAALFFLIFGIGSYGWGSRRENDQPPDNDYRDGYGQGYDDGYEDAHDDYHDENHFDDDFFE